MSYLNHIDFGDISILAVDDTRDNLFLLETILAENDQYQVQLAENGETALQMIQKSPPDVILLDVMMPGLNGYDVTRQIRRDQNLPYIPILLLTAHDQSSLVQGLDVGADDFLRKPFNLDELLARVRAMVRLKKSMDAYRYMARQRDDFVARLTHDLRTPLVAANRMLQFCHDDTFGEVSVDVKEALQNVIDNNDNLLAMTDTLLEVYRHDAGRKQLTLCPISMRSLCQDIIKELIPLAQEKGIHLVLTVTGTPVNPVKDMSANGTGGPSRTQTSDPYVIEGDRIELRRLITNLIGNAIKFTDDGYVLLKLSLPSSNQVQIDVEDTGKGMSDDELEQAFSWFRQGNHLKAGSGLGLHLAQRIAQLHGGQIAVKSTLGEGSVFTLSLPIALLNEHQN